MDWCDSNACCSRVKCVFWPVSWDSSIFLPSLVIQHKLPIFNLGYSESCLFIPASSLSCWYWPAKLAAKQGITESYKNAQLSPWRKVTGCLPTPDIEEMPWHAVLPLLAQGKSPHILVPLASLISSYLWTQGSQLSFPLFWVPSSMSLSGETWRAERVKQGGQQTFLQWAPWAEGQNCIVPKPQKQTVKLHILGLLLLCCVHWATELTFLPLNLLIWRMGRVILICNSSCCWEDERRLTLVSC